MLIHDRFVFLHLPKTGGTFIASALKRELPGSLTRGAPGRKHPGWEDIPEGLDDRPVLVYVRNPWDWYVSWYHAVLPPRFGPHGCPKAGVNGFDTVVRAACEGLIDPDGGRGAPSQREDFYTARIHRFFGGGLGSDRLVVGRYESLIEDLDRFLTRVGAPLDSAALARIRAAAPLNATDHKPYREYYSEQLRDLVGRCCRMPIERFGYSF
jgi:hypothetical protein